MKLLTGNQIARKRKEHDLTQKELGLQVDCKPSYLSFIEGGYRPKDLSLIEHLTEILTQPVSVETAKIVAERDARRKARATRANKKKESAEG